MSSEQLYEQSKAYGKWVYITPVSGVKLTPSVDNEFRINKSLLISKEKLTKVRKRIGLPKKFSELNKDKWTKEFFDMSDVFCILYDSGKPDEVKTKCRKIAKEELSILALSQLGYRTRHYGIYPTLFGESYELNNTEYLFCTSDERRKISSSTQRFSEEIIMGKGWVIWQRENFFSPLLNIIQNKTDISRDWRGRIYNAAKFIGQGMCSSDATRSFLWNMIAIETLFNYSNGKFEHEFPKQAEAFLGWTGFWSRKNYANKIKELYDKRCKLVHQGICDDINIDDVLFLDELIFQLLSNLLRHPKLFPNQEKVIEFCNKVEAEHLLGLKSKVIPKTFQYMPFHI